jgi:hydroxymethylglutaryl-CoA reductase
MAKPSEDQVPSSRISGFYKLPVAERLQRVGAFAGLSAEHAEQLARSGNLDSDLADHMIENFVTTLAIPVGIATNFRVDGRDLLVPMATEESSVVAAASNAARQCYGAGGFTTSLSASEMIGQIQLLDVPDPEAAAAAIGSRRAEIAALCEACDPLLVSLGGGFRDVEVRRIDAASGPMVVVHIIVDTRDAMGANAVNSIAERLAPLLADWTGGRPLLRILSNLADRRLARAEAVWPLAVIGGSEVRDGLIAAFEFADADPYRAATHNKGIMNGISAVVLATGNDTRAVEAGAHAFAARTGRYRSLSTWSRTPDGDLKGTIELPMAVGLVGGLTWLHPTVRALLAVLAPDNAGQLARVIAAVGLAQNFAAMKALATEGIQRGHMSLHAHNIAIGAGASGAEIEALAAGMIAARSISAATAEAMLAELRASA